MTDRSQDGKRIYGMYRVRMELFEATPKEVWREYFDNGYTWAKAIDEELSHAETIYEH